MELVDVSLTPLQQRAGAVWVPWRDLAAQQRRRGEKVAALAPGDDVMLRLDDGRVCRGWVLRNTFAGSDGASVIMFGPWLDRRAPVQAERRPEQRAPVASTSASEGPARRG